MLILSIYRDLINNDIPYSCYYGDVFYKAQSAKYGAYKLLKPFTNLICKGY